MKAKLIQSIIDSIRGKAYNGIPNMRWSLAENLKTMKIVLNNYSLRNEVNCETAPDYKWAQTIRSLLSVMDVKNCTDHYVRVGRDNDGGYVMFDDFSSNSIAYSFGINDDVSWDKDIASRNIDVFMYDHTIVRLPEHNRRFHFFKNGITGSKPQQHCKTMEEFVRENGHQNHNNLILKMDVEGCEWDFLQQVPSNVLSQFSQMVFEFHEMTRGQYDGLIVPALEKLNTTHQAVHLHANNYGNVKWMGNRFLPETFEVTYLRRSDHEFVPSVRSFPTPLDQPCNQQLPDIVLGYWGCGKLR